MSTDILNKLSSAKGTKSDDFNKKLAKNIISKNDKAAVEVLVRNLGHQNKKIQGDILSTLSWVGMEKPKLIDKYAPEYIEVLSSSNNRLVWGAMLTLSTIALSNPDPLFKARKDIINATEKGSVITKDNGIKTLALVAATKPKYKKEVFKYLLRHLKTCRSKDIPQHSESISVAVDKSNQDEFVKVLEKRMGELSSSQASRVRKVLKQYTG